ncbi:hypothetical protein H2C98_02035 [Vibrio parahaemolyticus]|uniref:hypothetical protein n=1 Tax=Vibrio parahaemolyticus TaxID=670 RepID=UPI00211A7947|nr:hypothetical protein [Vibrio parahaemolyticus]MCQ9040255.1 hypothetical protein [Vibrio parahaemolyticus]
MDGILEIVATSSFVGMLVGGLITHNLTLGRDKRKEYNDAIRPLKSLVSQASRSPLKGSLTRESIDAVEHYVSPRVYVKLVEALNEYREKMAETTQTDGWGVPYMDEQDKVEVRAILTKMDKLLKVK